MSKNDFVGRMTSFDFGLREMRFYIEIEVVLNSRWRYLIMGWGIVLEDLGDIIRLRDAIIQAGQKYYGGSFGW